MANILPPEYQFGDLLSQGLDTGLGSAIQGIGQGANKQGLSQMFGQQGLPPALAYMPEQVQAAYLKNFGAAQQLGQKQRQATPGVRESFNKLYGLSEQGLGSNWLTKLFSADSDEYDIEKKRLEKRLKPFYGDIVLPDSSVAHDVRQRELENVFNQINKDFGSQGAQQLLQTQAPDSNVQPTVEGQPQEQASPQSGFGNTGIGSALRGLGGGLLNAVGPAANILKSGAGTPTIASDIVETLENLRPKNTDAEIEEIASFMPKSQADQLRKLQQDEQRSIKLTDLPLPSTGNIKSLVEKVIPNNLFEPRSNGEKLIQNVISKAINLKSLGKNTLGMALAKGTSGVLGREFFGGSSPLQQNIAELLFTSAPDVLYNNARNISEARQNKEYDLFRDSAAARQNLDVERSLKASRSLRNTPGALESLPSNQKLEKVLLDFEKKAADGKVRFGEAVKTKKDLYRYINEADLDRTAEGALQNFTKDFLNNIHQEGAKLDASGYSHFKKADQIAAGLKQGESVVKGLYNAFKSGKVYSSPLRVLQKSGVGGALGGAGLGLAKGSLYASPPGALAGVAAEELYRYYKFLRETPDAIEDLSKIAKDQLQGNLKAAAARVASLDKKGQKWDRKNRNIPKL